MKKIPERIYQNGDWYSNPQYHFSTDCIVYKNERLNSLQAFDMEYILRNYKDLVINNYFNEHFIKDVLND